MTGSLLVAGTTSDAGKSVVTTGLCRAFARRGLRVAPYKAQNMSNNSMVTGDGAEIGRAQWVQAVAARAEPEAAMNPVLLKPGSDHRSHVVVMGRPAGRLEANEFAGGRQALADAAFAAYDDLVTRFDVVVCEGAGSPAEVNLRAHDYVNMGLARHGRIPTVVVGDIDRGGVFAAMHGTVALLDEADQALVAGFVVNKFRGDLGLLRPGLKTLEELTGRPVLGVLPWVGDLWLDSEDSLAMRAAPTPSASKGQRLRVAVVALPRISNFTDIDALRTEPGLDVEYVGRTPPDRRRRRGGAAGNQVHDRGPRVAPGEWAGRRGRGARGARRSSARHLRRLPDARPEGVRPRRHRGLARRDGRRARPARRANRVRCGEGAPAADRHGAGSAGRRLRDPPRAGQGRYGRGVPRRGPLRGACSARCGTAAWRATSCVGRGCRGRGARRRKQLRPRNWSFAARREAQVDRLADLLEEHLDVDGLLDLADSGAPAMPVVRGGLA